MITRLVTVHFGTPKTVVACLVMCHIVVRAWLSAALGTRGATAAPVGVRLCRATTLDCSGATTAVGVRPATGPA